MSGSTRSMSRVYVILNPIAGTASAGEIHAALKRHLDTKEWIYDIYETTGKENVSEIVKAACENGAELVVAAGGDGTVAGVVNGLIPSGTPLGIIPVGTGNGLARALGIPLEVESAVQLLTGEHKIVSIDAMQVGEQYYILNVSTGISAEAIQETEPEQKRRFGIFAYAWTILGQALGFQTRRFSLTADDRHLQVRANEILVSNGTLLEEPPFPLGPPEGLSDGQIEVYILTANHFFDYITTLWDLLLRRPTKRSNLRHLTIKKRISINAIQRPDPVQADGEPVGQTPVEIRVASGAIPVVVPKKDQ
jgi:diacylglycerol kinase (ATP)